MTMLGSKGDNEGGGYNAAPAGDTYSQPAPQQNYGAPSQSTPQAAPQQQEPASNIPEIDINEDEIPF